MRIYLGRWGPERSPLLLLQVRQRLGCDPDQLRPIDHINDIHAPVLLIHGTCDQHTPIEEAREVSAAASEPKEWWAVDGAAHVNLHQFAGVEYERRVGTFLAERLGVQSH